MNWKKTQTSTTKGKLATAVAKGLEKFIAVRFSNFDDFSWS